VLLVHAHPDDESITTGATMAALVQAGVQVTLVTCTRGEKGEVIGAELAHLRADEEALARHRADELATAMSRLGVSDHRFLGEGMDRFRDSGMVWGPDGIPVPPPEVDADALCAVPLDVAASSLLAVLHETAPDAVICYDPGGGYGHPDHVRAHDLTARAHLLAASQGRDVPRYAVVVPEPVMRRAVEQLGRLDLPTLDPGAWPSMVVPADAADLVLGGEVYRAAKASALRAHASQVVVADDDTALALSNGVWQPLLPSEWLRREDVAPGLRRISFR